MARKATGSLYFRGSWFLSLRLGKRVSLQLPTCTSRGEAELRRQVIAEMARRLKAANQLAAAETICRQAATADTATLGEIVTLVNGLVKGTERVLPARASTASGRISSSATFGEFAKLWTSNELAYRHRRRVRRIDHTENIRRLEKHILPIFVDGRPISEIPLDEFTLRHADEVLAQPSLSEGSVRHIAQVMHRILKLAVYPAQLLANSPFPPGWLPSPNPRKEHVYLFPLEEAKLLGATCIPLVRRLFFGFCAREGLRRENAVTIEWDNLTLDLVGGGGHIALDTSKNGRGGSWRLDDGTAEAFRRWQRICPSDRYVFPTEALPKFRRHRAGKPLHVGKASDDLRGALRQAGVKRPKLFENSAHRQRLRVHDLRATFVTLSLARGESEDWVRTRTGHCSSSMIVLYRREAATAEELDLGWLHPLHNAIPELAEMSASEQLETLSTAPPTVQWSTNGRKLAPLASRIAKPLVD